MHVVFVQNHIRLSNLFRLSNCTLCTVLIESSQFYFFHPARVCQKSPRASRLSNLVVSFHFWRSRFKSILQGSSPCICLIYKQSPPFCWIPIISVLALVGDHHKLRLCDGNEERLQTCASCPQPHCFNSPPKVGEGTSQLPALPVSLPLPDGSQFRNLFCRNPSLPKKNHLLFNSRPFCSI